MKLKSTVHFIDATLSKPHSHCQYMVIWYAHFAHTFHQFQVPLLLTLKGSQKHLWCASENWHTFTGTCATLPLQTKLWKTHKWSCTAFQKYMGVWSQNSLEEAFRNLLSLWSSYPILRKSLPICRAAVQQTHIQKKALKVGFFFFFWHIPLLFPAWCVTFVYTETSIVFTVRYLLLHVLLVVKRNSAYGFPVSYTVSVHTDQILV